MKRSHSKKTFDFDKNRKSLNNEKNSAKRVYQHRMKNQQSPDTSNEPRPIIKVKVHYI